MCEGPAASGKWSDFSRLEEEAIDHFKKGYYNLPGFVYASDVLDNKEVFALLMDLMEHSRCAAILYRFNANRLSKQ